MCIPAALAAPNYNQLGSFIKEGDDDLVWKPEEGGEQQGAIDDWTAEPTKLCLLTLACLARRVSLELKEKLMERMPNHQWAPMPELTANMEEEALQRLVAESQPAA